MGRCSLKVTCRSLPESRSAGIRKLRSTLRAATSSPCRQVLLYDVLDQATAWLKACKGQTDSLLLAAAAQKFDMFLCVQDLTCPGASFLHSASLAARIPGVQAIEGNGRQYCPGPNRAWAKQFPGMFEITDGTVATGELGGVGLGF